MFQLSFSRKNLLAILLGFLTIIGIGVVNGLISFSIHSNMARTLGPADYGVALSHPPALLVAWTWIYKVTSIIFPLIGGAVVGWIIKEKGWVYGGLLGVILTLISIGIASLTLVLPSGLIYGPAYPANYGHDLAQKNIINQLVGAPFTIALVALGGWLGEKLHKKRSR